MHEYHKAVEWLNQACEEAKEKKAQEVRLLNVTFGESSGYSASVVYHYFQEAAKGTPCENAKFHVTVSRTMLRCPSCGKVYEKKLLDYHCPDCHTEGEPTETGTEVTLDSIEL